MSAQLLDSEELLNFFKALADANRLKIVGLLAQKPHTVEELAALLDIKPSTVSHHLARLSDAGLVSARTEGHYYFYSLQLEALERMARQFATRDALPRLSEDVDMDAYDRKVLASFTTPEGRIRALPMQEKKFQVLLRYVLKSIEPGKQYTEKQLNEVLAGFYEDTASLRRGMIEYKMMARAADGSAYWRLPDESAPAL